MVPRNYQRTKNNPYLLPHDLYMRVLYIIKGYDRIKGEYMDLAAANPPMLTGMPGSGKTSAPTEDKAIRRAMLFSELHAIDQALMTIPAEYRRGLMQNIKYGVKYPDTAHYNTWRYNKRKLTYSVAKRLKFI